MSEHEGPVWIFFRDGCFYPIQCMIPDDEEDELAMMAHIECNPRTFKVEDIEGNILWERKVH